MAAASVAVRLTASEAVRVARLIRLRWNGDRIDSDPPPRAPILDRPRIVQELTAIGVVPKDFDLDREDFERHVTGFRYPKWYAGGPVADGGFRESKILEYFISLSLLPVQPGDTVVDVASERSVFPEVVGQTIGARVLRQDLIYPVGLHGDRIGGSAEAMALPDHSVDKMFLHNSFEHFEEDTDKRFVREASRVLRRGGAFCVIPLYVSCRPQIITDPLVDSAGIVWDPDAEVVRIVGRRMRFGRFYSVTTLRDRVLEPARRYGFSIDVFHLRDLAPQSTDPLDRAYRGIAFAAVFQKT